ncbi:hypothetical protein AALO_G00268220 [Alosa alosa]|uniref:Uncharacterized protein n=1 Tax=Alosa alosa TaxID=278164 RepID=A0AAV6FMG7_9TELE|nr:hypothetical protein AALO_G00268220 [Alosa alosa]
MDPPDSTKVENDEIPTVVIVSSIVTLLALVTTTIWLCRQLLAAYGRAWRTEKNENETIQPVSERPSKSMPVKEEEPQPEDDVTEDVLDGETDG